MKIALPRLRDKLGSDPVYFQKVYNYTFEFSRPPGQRSLGMDMAKPFWGLLLPHGLRGGVLSARDVDGDDRMDDVEEGWRDEYMQWWFDFLDEKKLKGISKDVWQMVSIYAPFLCRQTCSSSFLQFLEFVRTIDSKFEKYDAEGVCRLGSSGADYSYCLHAAAWPSTIDDFVDYARNRLASGQ